MSMATRTDTQSPALHVADSHDLIRVRGARENNPIILRSARGAHRYSPKCPERLSEKGSCGTQLAFGRVLKPPKRSENPPLTVA